MPRLRPLRLVAALLAPVLAPTLGGCFGPPEAPPGLDLGARDVATHYVEAGASRTLLFETWLHNPTDSARTFHLFAHASDDLTRPPARAVYPPRALGSMPADRTFGVADPRLGLPVTIAPGDSARFGGALPMPRATADGRAIRSTAFRDLTVYAYDEAGHNVYRRHWPLVRVRGEEDVR